MKVIAAVLLALTLAACGEGGEAATGPKAVANTEIPDGPLRDLYDAAKVANENEIVLYGPPGAYSDQFFDIFEKQFPGITVRMEPVWGADLQSLVDADYSQKDPKADLFFPSAPDFGQLREKGYLEPYLPETAEGLGDEYIEDQWNTPALLIYGPLYNKSRVTGDDIPNSWEDIVSKRFEGRLGTSDPMVTGSAAQNLQVALREGVIDEDWIRREAAMKPLVFPSMSAATQAVANGQIDLAVQVSYANYLLASGDGAPVGFGILDEGQYAGHTPIGLAKDAPHPNAAKLLMSWLYSPDGQAALAGFGLQGTMPDAPAVKDLDGIKLLVYPDNEHLKELDGYMAKLKQLWNE